MTCPRCGAGAAAGHRFCGRCGARLVAGPDAPPAPELRQVSVLFCDLVGFTPLAEALDPDDVRRLLSGYYATAREVIGRSGGAVEKYVGDAVMAVWGVPTAREDDAERAVRAAGELVGAVAGYGSRVGRPLRVRVGVATGRAAAVAVPEEGLVVGDCVNTAARIQALAPPGAVLVDDLTRRATATVRYRAAGSRPLRGKTGSVALWQPLGPGDPAGLVAPLVDRVAERAVLEEALTACMRERHAELVVVTGPAGVGKSRLLQEFTGSPDRRPVVRLTGRCPSDGDGGAFAALAQAVRSCLDVPPDAGPARDLVRAGLRRWGLDPDGPVAAAVGLLLGTEAEPPAGRLSAGELFAGWRALLERVADAAPVVLAVEDAHRAEPDLLAFLGQLLDWSSGHRLCLLLLGRPELLDRCPELLDRPHVTRLAVEPLPAPAIAQLIDGLLPALPPGAHRVVAGAADGIPLYVVEGVRALLDRGLVEVADGAARLRGPVDGLEVPATLTALLQARLDALPRRERALARSLSVLGGTFPRATAAAASGLAGDDLDAALAGLVRAGVLVEEPGGRWSFAQSLLRTVAAGTLGRRERKARHLQVARSVPGSPEPDPAEVAWHLRMAWSCAPEDPDAGALRARAAEAYAAAAARAGALGAPASAEQAYRSAAELTDDEPRSLELLAEAAGMADRAGRREQAVELYDRVAAASRAAGRPGAARALVSPTCRVLLNLGRVEQARARLREVLDEVDPAAPASAPWVLGMARVAVVSAERAAADELTGRALALGAALGDRALLADAASLRADALLLLDRPQEALDAYRRAEELLGADGDPDERVRVLLRRGLALMGSDQDAGPALRAGLDLALRTGNATGRGFAAVLLAEQDMWRGRWDEAERRVREELETSPQPPREHGMLHAVLAQNSALRGRVDQLGDSLASLGALARTGSGQLRAVHAVVVGLVAAATGDLDRAFQQWSGTVRAFAPRAGWYLDPVRHAWPLALDAALRTGRRAEAADLLALVAGRPADRVPPFLRAQLLRFRARLRAGDGGAPDAVEQDLRAAVTGLDVLGYPYWRAVAQADLAAWLGGTGRGREAAAVAEQAAATCRELGVERVPAHG